MTRTFTTTLTWHDSTGKECSADAKVTYQFYRGHPGDRVDPPEPPSVEIVAISGDDIPARFYEDEDLITECFEDYAGWESDGEEYRAEQRADSSLKW